MTRVSPLSRVCALVVTAALLAGCGGGGEDAPASASYGIETLMPAVAKAVGGEESVHLGLGDQRGRPDMQIDLSWSGPQEFRALIGDTPGQFLEYIHVNGRVYVGGEAAENTWTYLADDDPRTLGEEKGFDSAAAPVLLALDVTADYEALVDAVDKVENKGEEEMAGVPSTHYVVTVDVKAWHDQLPEKSMHRQAEVDDPLLIDLWIDENSLPVRLEYEAASGNDDVRVDFASWGKPIAVLEPPNAEPLGSEAS